VNIDVLKRRLKMMLFDMEFIPVYPDNRLFAYMAATCDYQGHTQLYIREFKPI